MKRARLRAGIVVPQEDAAYSASEIENRAPDRRFVQVIFSPRASDPIGHRRYWPIYEAAERNNLPIGLHSAGFSGGHPSTGSGWPTYYMQEHYAFSTSMQSVVTSLSLKGCVNASLNLKGVRRSGVSLGPRLLRMDKHGRVAPSSAVKGPQSEYLRERFWSRRSRLGSREARASDESSAGRLDRLIFSAIIRTGLRHRARPSSSRSPKSKNDGLPVNAKRIRPQGTGTWLPSGRDRARTLEGRRGGDARSASSTSRGISRDLEPLPARAGPALSGHDPGSSIDNPGQYRVDAAGANSCAALARMEFDTAPAVCAYKSQRCELSGKGRASENLVKGPYVRRDIGVTVDEYLVIEM